MSFDGDDYVDLGNSNSLDFENQNQLTLSAWVNPTNLNGQKAVITSMSTLTGSNGASGHSQYALKIENQKIYFICGPTAYGFEPNGPTVGSTSLNLNEWQHITVTYDGSVLKFYLNGILDFQENIPNQVFPQSSGIFEIGRYGPMNNGSFHYFDGVIDDVSIWNTALSQSTIQQYMNCPPLGNEAGLSGYWNFEEGNGSTVNDQTSNGNNGIINGATYSTDFPEQSCQLTTVNDCDGVAVLNLTISGPDTSYTEVTACDSYEWNGITYSESGTYSYSVNSVTNNHSMSFDGFDDYVTVNNNLGSTSQMSISVWLNIENQSTGPKDILSLIHI